jgi:hypothetical protein
VENMRISDKIKELQDYLNQYGDIIIVRQSSNYELKGNYIDENFEINSRVKPMIKEIRTFRDDFDGIRYDKNVYVYNKDGENVLLL